MELTFLGTGAGVPAKERNVSAIALKFLNNNGAVWLFDCGEATQHQILHTSIKPSKIEKIFITHLHGDHIFGLPGLLGSRSFQGGETELTIYGPKGIKSFVETALTVSGTHLKYPLKIEEVDEEWGIETSHYSVTSALLEHGIPCFGYRVVEKDQPGELNVKRLQEMGIAPGPIYRELKEGKKITLPDGSTLDGNTLIGPAKKGRIIAILGDTRVCENAVNLSKSADLVIHEATFKSNEHELAHRYFHSTAKEAAAVAEKAGAKRLILTHISSRYQKESALELVNEARENFTNTEIASDLAMYKVEKE
ncbi:ribonuclease Z [Lottiidibacillus patelloidae]|uniref:Ribonuclease Z n=1 Tax=Lottiidibacillus patelloidae TaxID=2670334 RepID=A0A263BYH6_9BACI|nr:ribonuclease Z [Lottiidibacillus patelloidae]OZM58668.1 ribonuclease Z [Lottiidibacillus patelloidae]